MVVLLMNNAEIDVFEKIKSLLDFNDDNIAFLFNSNDLNIDSLKKIRARYDEPIYEADLCDFNAKNDFELLKLECETSYKYYSALYDYIKNKQYFMPFDYIPYGYDIVDLYISLDVKAELKKTVDILNKYYSALSEYESTFEYY